jgi:hypothetical protein
MMIITINRHLESGEKVYCKHNYTFWVKYYLEVKSYEYQYDADIWCYILYVQRVSNLYLSNKFSQN